MILDKKLAIFFTKIVEYYIKTGLPLGSKNMVEEFKLDISSATARNLMVKLEKFNFVEKAHISSGRIPSHLGLEYYTKNLANIENNDLRLQLEHIFLQRNLSIDQVVELAAQVISDVIGITLITSEANNNELLKSIQLVPLTNKMSTIILVTSTGNVFSRKLDLGEHNVNLEDLRIAVRIFKERLVNIPLSQLSDFAKSLYSILSESIHNYEGMIQMFVRKVFSMQKTAKNHVYGKSNLILSDSIKRKDLIKLMNVIESQSIWTFIENKDDDDDETIKIDIRPDNTSFLSKRLFYDNQEKELTAVGDSKMDFGKTKSALLLVEELIEKIGKKKLRISDSKNEIKEK